MSALRRTRPAVMVDLNLRLRCARIVSVQFYTFDSRNSRSGRAFTFRKHPSPQGAYKDKERIMRTMTQALLALGFVGAMAIGTPVPTKAQGIYLPGVGVEIGTPDRRYDRRYYRDYDNSYAYDRRYQQRYNNWNGCPRNYTIQDGRCKPYRGY